MKKSIVFSLLLIISSACLGQQTTTPAPMTQGDYLGKAKKQSRVARVLLISGAALTTTGVILASGNAGVELFAIFYNEHSAGYRTGVVLLGSGIITMAGSIPFFVAASKNRRRAATVTASLKVETSCLPYKGSLAINKYPALSVRISF